METSVESIALYDLLDEFGLMEDVGPFLLSDAGGNTLHHLVRLGTAGVKRCGVAESTATRLIAAAKSKIDAELMLKDLLDDFGLLDDVGPFLLSDAGGNTLHHLVRLGATGVKRCGVTGDTATRLIAAAKRIIAASPAVMLADDSTALASSPATFSGKAGLLLEARCPPRIPEWKQELSTGDPPNSRTCWIFRGSCLNWLWCFAALQTNKDLAAAAAAAGYKELFFGVPGWVACVWAAAGAGGKDKEGIPHFQPCCLLFSVQLSRLRRALPLGQGLEAFLSGWAMGHGSRVFVASRAPFASELTGDFGSSGALCFLRGRMFLALGFVALRGDCVACRICLGHEHICLPDVAAAFFTHYPLFWLLPPF